jgi:inactivated superfamily I helicase
MSKKKEPKVLSPFEQNEKNIRIFHENVKMYESVVLLTQAALALDLTSEAGELCELEGMLKSTIKQFSEYIEERGGKWN